MVGRRAAIEYKNHAASSRLLGVSRKSSNKLRYTATTYPEESESCRPTKLHIYLSAMDPTTWENPAEDMPLPPPPLVAQTIPNWDVCGAQSCAKHDHSSNSSPPGLAVDVATPRELVSPCDVCEDKLGKSKMHMLDCGHMLCQPCLVDMALDFHGDVVVNRAEIDELLKARDDLVAQARKPGRSKEDAATLRALADSWHLEALDLTGYLCCGRSTGLGKFIYCMEPKLAKIIWLDVYMFLTPVAARAYCGWPDCGRFLPPNCRYLRNESHIWHCVSCGGNSQISSSNRDGVKRFCPAR